jgi:hypothetical protein
VARGDAPKPDDLANTDDFKACIEAWTKNEEMSAALETWCAHLERLVMPAEGAAVLR